jgi:hypothetical protein
VVVWLIRTWILIGNWFIGVAYNHSKLPHVFNGHHCLDHSQGIHNLHPSGVSLPSELPARGLGFNWLLSELVSRNLLELELLNWTCTPSRTRSRSNPFTKSRCNSKCDSLELQNLSSYGNTYCHKFCFCSLCVTADMCLNNRLPRRLHIGSAANATSETCLSKHFTVCWSSGYPVNTFLGCLSPQTQKTWFVILQQWHIKLSKKVPRNRP